jgi:hypothetical protein
MVAQKIQKNSRQSVTVSYINSMEAEPAPRETRFKFRETTLIVLGSAAVAGAIAGVAITGIDAVHEATQLVVNTVKSF